MEYFFTFFIGTILGSFASFLTYRITSDASVTARDSMCTSCKHKLSFLDLVPLFSWLALRGKCRYCKAQIGCRYPLIEFSAALFSLYLYVIFGLSLNNLFLFLTFFLLFISIITDLEHYIIPESIQILLIFSASCYGFYNNYTITEILLQPLIALAFGLIIKYGFLYIRKKDGLGLADITLFYVVTIFLGIQNFLMLLFLSGVIGVLFGLIWTKVTKSKYFPFAPAIVIAFVICLSILQKSDHNNLVTLLFYTL